MAWTKIKTATAMSALAIATATPLVIQSNQLAKLRQDNEGLRQKTEMIPQLQAENQQLAALRAEATGAGEFERGRGEAPRRLMAARDDSRPLYLNSQGFRVGCVVFAGLPLFPRSKERGPVEDVSGPLTHF